MKKTIVIFCALLTICSSLYAMNNQNKKLSKEAKKILVKSKEWEKKNKENKTIRTLESITEVEKYQNTAEYHQALLMLIDLKLKPIEKMLKKFPVTTKDKHIISIREDLLRNIVKNLEYITERDQFKPLGAYLKGKYLLKIIEVNMLLLKEKFTQAISALEKIMSNQAYKKLKHYFVTTPLFISIESLIEIQRPNFIKARTKHSKLTKNEKIYKFFLKKIVTHLLEKAPKKYTHNDLGYIQNLGSFYSSRLPHQNSPKKFKKIKAKALQYYNAIIRIIEEQNYNKNEEKKIQELKSLIKLLLAQPRLTKGKTNRFQHFNEAIEYKKEKNLNLPENLETIIKKISRPFVCCVCQKKQENIQEKMKKCSLCKLVYYCSRECQKKDWLKHKEYCKKYREAQKEIEKKSTCSGCKKNFPFLKLQKCAGCKNARYCSEKCQIKDWRKHTKICRKKIII